MAFVCIKRTDDDNDYDYHSFTNDGEIGTHDDDDMMFLVGSPSVIPTLG